PGQPVSPQNFRESKRTHRHPKPKPRGRLLRQSEETLATLLLRPTLARRKRKAAVWQPDRRWTSLRHTRAPPDSNERLPKSAPRRNPAGPPRRDQTDGGGDLRLILLRS